MKTSIIIFAVILLVATFICPSFSFAAEKDCSNLQTQTEMNICAGESLEKTDQELDKTYRTTLKFIKTLDDKTSDAVFSEEQFLQSQRDWEKYRDSSCEVETAWCKGGSMHSMQISGCREGLSIRRTEDLKLLNQFIEEHYTVERN